MGRHPNSWPDLIRKLDGKTISNAEHRGCSLVIHFTDGTAIEITDYSGPGQDQEWDNYAVVTLEETTGERKTIFRT
jgi:hypothetical protein